MLRLSSDASEVSERLTRDVGVVTLPAELFCQEMVTGGDSEDMAVNSVSLGITECGLGFPWPMGGMRTFDRM